MSAYPVMLDGSTITALVVGGGAVAARKVRALLESGAKVFVVAPDVSPELEALARTGEFELAIVRAPYNETFAASVSLVIAATNDREINARVARDAKERGRLVNVVDAPELGDFVTPAVHRAGDVIVAVSAGGVPAAAARLRDSIARRLDARYADAMRELAELRDSLIGQNRRERWHDASRALIGDDFCARVESGELRDRIGEWR